MSHSLHSLCFESLKILKEWKRNSKHPPGNLGSVLASKGALMHQLLWPFSYLQPLQHKCNQWKAETGQSQVTETCGIKHSLSGSRGAKHWLETTLPSFFKTFETEKQWWPLPGCNFHNCNWQMQKTMMVVVTASAQQTMMSSSPLTFISTPHENPSITCPQRDTLFTSYIWKYSLDPFYPFDPLEQGSRVR